MKIRYTFFGNLDVGDKFYDIPGRVCTKVEKTNKEMSKGYIIMVNYRIDGDASTQPERYLQDYAPVELVL